MKKETYPKIGIRPIIDGRRRGIRESLEKITMDMAKRVAAFYSESLYYPDGSPVECIIADSTIGGVKEASDCAAKFERENVGLTLSVTPCWCYGAETIDMNPLIPKAIWGFNGTERPGAVYLAAALSAHTQFGLPAFGIYGRDVQNLEDPEIPEDVRIKLLRFAKAGLAVSLMRGKSYLAIGSVSMGIAGSIVNPDILRNYFGMRTEYVDCSEILRRIQCEIFDTKEFYKAMKWTQKYCISREGEDRNRECNKRTREQKENDWEFVVKMTLIMRDLMIGNSNLEADFGEEACGHNAIAGGFQGQRQWTDFLPDGDFSEAILNSSFDWNGIRAPFIFATEDDYLNGMSMLFNYLLTNTAQIFADVRTYWSPKAIENATKWKPDGLLADGFLHLINSGSCTLDGTGQQTDKDGNPIMKPFWKISEREVEKMLDATIWYPANLEYMRGGGYSSKFLTKGHMPVTMCRLNMVRGLGLVLQIAEGWTVELPKNVFDIIDNCTDMTWPSTFFIPRLTGKGRFKNVYSVMNFWGANHGAISYGHIGADLITLASLLRIPVSMHNVDDNEIFRPSAWSAFGTDDEVSDYKACETYGPVYGHLK